MQEVTVVRVQLSFGSSEKKQKQLRNRLRDGLLDARGSIGVSVRERGLPEPVMAVKMSLEIMTLCV